MCVWLLAERGIFFYLLNSKPVVYRKKRETDLMNTGKKNQVYSQCNLLLIGIITFNLYHKTNNSKTLSVLTNYKCLFYQVFASISLQ